MRLNNPTDAVPDCDAIQDLVAEYAFGLTDPEQTRLVETNLPACPEAAVQLADFKRIQAEMRTAVPQIEPSTGLEARLMAAIAIPAPAETHPPTLVKAVNSVATVSSTPKPLRHWYTQPMWLVAAALLLLVVSNAIWFLRMEELTRREADLLTQLANKTEAEQAFVIANTDGLRWVRLPPSETEANSQVVAVLMWNAESQIGLLYAQNLPKLTPNTTYQLWLTKGEVRVSAGTFSIDETGKAAYLFHIYQSIDNYTWARITVEPAQGSDSPSDTVVVNGKIALS
jgi:anti-sigma-K factor RskA